MYKLNHKKGDLLEASKHEKSAEDAKKKLERLKSLNPIRLINSFCGAICEELVFRYLQKKTLRCLSPIKSSILVGLNFGLAHLTSKKDFKFNLIRIFKTSILGFVCAILRQKVGLFASIFFHIGFNIKSCQHEGRYRSVKLLLEDLKVLLQPRFALTVVVNIIWHSLHALKAPLNPALLIIKKQ